MPDGIDLSSNIEPIVELVGQLRFGGARADKFARLRSQLTRGWATTEQYADQLDRLYEDIARSGHNVDWLVQAADLVHQSEAAQREKLRPGIEALKEKLTAQRISEDAEAHRIIEES